MGSAVTPPKFGLLVYYVIVIQRTNVDLAPDVSLISLPNLFVAIFLTNLFVHMYPRILGEELKPINTV